MPRIATLLLAIFVVAAAAATMVWVYENKRGPVHAPASMAGFVLSPKPEPLPDVAFNDAAGKRHSLAEFRGHYVLLNLWATWCAPCVRELPSLARLQEAMGKSLTIVPVDVGRDDAASARQFFHARGVDKLPVYLDSDMALARALKGIGLPLTVLIDPKGREAGRLSGGADWGSPEAVQYIQAITARASS